MNQVAHEYLQTNVAPPHQVFPLLCPVREAEWVPGWRYRLIHSESGIAELGCVFATPNDCASETIWLVTHYDPLSFEIHYAWVRQNLLATRLEIKLIPAPNLQTSARIRYVYTALSRAGEAELASYDSAWFTEKMESWQHAINYFLRTGKCFAPAPR